MPRTVVNILESLLVHSDGDESLYLSALELVCYVIVPECLLTPCFLYCLLARSESSHFPCAHPTPPHPISALLTLHSAEPKSKPWFFQHLPCHSAWAILWLGPSRMTQWIRHPLPCLVTKIWSLPLTSRMREPTSRSCPLTTHALWHMFSQ